MQWLDYCYGVNYKERHFDETKIPQVKVVIDEAKIKEKDSLIEQKDSEIEAPRLGIPISGMMSLLRNVKLAVYSPNPTFKS